MVDVQNSAFANVSCLGQVIFEERCVAQLVSLFKLLGF
jgi:hypothetical protein